MYFHGIFLIFFFFASCSSVGLIVVAVLPIAGYWLLAGLQCSFSKELLNLYFRGMNLDYGFRLSNEPFSLHNPIVKL